MPRVQLLHWKAEEADRHLETLRAAGYQVEYHQEFRPALMKSWRESPPDAFVIDLSRLPSQGREIAIALRQSPRTRSVPLVFCGGDPEKVARIKTQLPDAFYGSLANLRSTVRKALAHPPADPIKPVQMMDRYRSRTAAQKLGLKESGTLKLLEPPRNVMQVLGELPAGVQVLEDDSTLPASVTLCFLHEPHALLSMLSRVRPLAAATKLWILWRKGGAAAHGAVTESLVREHALAIGLVDYKICSVNEVWSALLFAAKR